MDIERNRSNRHNHPNESIISSSYKCLCQCIRLTRYLPFVIIFGHYFYALFVYMYFVIYKYYEQIWIQSLLVIFFLPFYLLSLISYVKCVFTSHRPIAPEFTIPDSMQLDQMTEDERNQNFESLIQTRNLPIFTRAYNGQVRFCPKCWVLKPDRAHHCSVCGKCICKMDHHCHWVSNCVAFDNYKCFILFLFYTSVTCLYTVLSSIKLFLKFWKDESYPGKIHVFFVVLFCLIFLLSISILLSYHLYLVFKNVTTLESYQTPRFKQYEYDYYRYNLGYKRNLKSVFGDNKLLWFLPIFSSLGDGHYYQLPLIPGLYDKSNSLTVCDVTSSSYPQALLQSQQHSHSSSFNNI
ncbi:Palmitoyltransferase zdhhc2 [Dermatophagoides pteronyssinus]|uniref:Palmitoyltransferase n=1 Tax=Dermatophagoides pteronyssinus TaxID=6956 RepID=A0ABQ8JW10_DERPT|nr:Palmitoyltransferase zdhhc2 [Dermatophagoides pteronyssinus]